MNLELVVEVVNINPGNNKDLMEKCKSLREYVIFIEKIRMYAASQPIEEAVERAVNECIEEDVLAEFLLHNKAEAIKMSIFEYNQEAHMKCVRQEGYAEGMTDGIAIGKSQGIIEGILELLANLGEVPKEFEESLSGADMQQLKTWHRLAARAESIEGFLQMLHE